MLGLSSTVASSENGMSAATRFKELLVYPPGTYHYLNNAINNLGGGIEADSKLIGNFDAPADDDFWDVTTNCTVSISGEQLKLTNDGGSNGSATINVYLSTRTRYSLTYTFDKSTNSDANGLIMLGEQPEPLDSIASTGTLTAGTAQTNTIEFVSPRDNLCRITFSSIGDDGEFTFWDDLSLKHRTDG